MSERSRTATLWFTASRAETATLQTPYSSAKYEVRSTKLGGIPPRHVDFVLRTSHFVLAFAPTRTRTWNTQLEAAHDFLFTIGANHPFAFQAEGKGVEPSSRQARTALAERPGQPYPATFRICHSVDPPRIELGFPDCQPGVVPLDHEPLFLLSVGEVGIEPTVLLLPPCARLTWGSRARLLALNLAALPSLRTRPCAFVG